MFPMNECPLERLEVPAFKRCERGYKGATYRGSRARSAGVLLAVIWPLAEMSDNGSELPSRWCAVNIIGRNAVKKTFWHGFIAQKKCFFLICHCS
jgi:hypothetical protein